MKLADGPKLKYEPGETQSTNLCVGDTIDNTRFYGDTLSRVIITFWTVINAL